MQDRLSCESEVKGTMRASVSYQGPTIYLLRGGGGGGGGVGDFWSPRIFFFPSNLVGRIFFFPLLNALQDIFFTPRFSAGFFFSSKKGHVFTYTKCIYIYIVAIAVIGLIWSCKALKCCKLYKIIIVQLCFRKVILYTHSILRQNKIMHHKQL